MEHLCVLIFGRDFLFHECVCVCVRACVQVIIIIIIQCSIELWCVVYAVQLVELFGSTRDGWIESDLDGWLAPNRIYPGVAEVMKRLMEHHHVYIVTTKQARFTEMILRNMAGIDFPAERIFSQTTSGRPKSEVLEMLEERHPRSRYHFVEDKFTTLEKVMASAKLESWNLYLVDWGYNVKRERDAADASQRIRLISIDDFSSLAK